MELKEATEKTIPGLFLPLTVSFGISARQKQPSDCWNAGTFSVCLFLY
ncbi:MAG: hypothetical protein LBL57_09010 [Tannerella sp.]|nr:hypothetical protein [Tannerella sp.]